MVCKKTLEIFDDAILEDNPTELLALANNEEAIKFISQTVFESSSLVNIDEHSPLHFAAKFGSKKCLKAFLDLGADPNCICQDSKGDQFPLLCCVFDYFREEQDVSGEDICEMLELLLSKGADANCKCVSHDGTELPCFRFAIDEGVEVTLQRRLCDLLLDKGVDPNTPVIDGVIAICFPEKYL